MHDHMYKWFTYNVLEHNCWNFSNNTEVAVETARGCRLHPKVPLKVKDLFDTIEAHKIIDFIKETRFYKQL